MSIIKSPYPPLPPLPEINVYDVLFERPDQDRAGRQAVWPDYTIHIEEKTGRRRTYKELVECVRWGATALGTKASDGGLGLTGDGDEMIGLLGNNSLVRDSFFKISVNDLTNYHVQEYIDIVLSLITVTTPFTLISTYSTRFELVHALKLTKATRLFVDATLLPDVLAAIQDPEVHIPADKIYILSGQGVNGRESFTQMIDGMKRKNIPLEPVRPAKKDTLAYLVLSSGTSGLPKAVMITHGNIIYANYQMTMVNQFAAPYAAPRPEGSVLITIGVFPMFHACGLHAYIFWASLRPTTYVILEKWNTEHFLRAIVKYRATDLGLIPSAIHQLVNHPAIKSADLSSVISITSGAAYLPPELEAQMTRFLNEGTGIYQDARGARASLLGDVKHGPPPPNTMGILLPGLDGRIVRDDGTSAAPGEPGELWLRGGNITAGYWNNPQANANAFVDGWLRTGDQFRADEKGYFFFADRAKDTLKVSGIQVSPNEIEDVLFAHPEKLISDVSVAGVSGGRTADEKRRREEGAPAAIPALEKWHRESLSRYKWLRGGIEVVEEIPKTPTGKNKRRVLQDEYERRLKETKAKL
ncbi:hypothetical protein B0H13DRAFT_2527619 [Mycena leptocephala]|nr:hypothetical protein B0H13DRAFT_2527619 [Mycena leptocephala]